MITRACGLSDLVSLLHKSFRELAGVRIDTATIRKALKFICPFILFAYGPSLSSLIAETILTRILI